MQDLSPSLIFLPKIFQPCKITTPNFFDTRGCVIKLEKLPNFEASRPAALCCRHLAFQEFLEKVLRWARYEFAIWATFAKCYSHHTHYVGSWSLYAFERIWNQAVKPGKTFYDIGRTLNPYKASSKHFVCCCSRASYQVSAVLGQKARVV